jgi:mono/diheme cytochrome c family protein
MLKAVVVAAASSALFVALPIAMAQQTAAPPPSASAGPQVSVWSGVYTDAQAARGKTVYSANCGKCHGPTGNGAGEPDAPKSPPVARATFLRNWDGKTLAAMFELVRTTMPIDNPASRTDPEYIDAIAYVLSLSTIPAGAKELPPDAAALAGIVIRQQP